MKDESFLRIKCALSSSNQRDKKSGGPLSTNFLLGDLCSVLRGCFQFKNFSRTPSKIYFLCWHCVYQMCFTGACLVSILRPNISLNILHYLNYLAHYLLQYLILRKQYNGPIRIAASLISSEVIWFSIAFDMLCCVWNWLLACFDSNSTDFERWIWVKN